MLERAFDKALTSTGRERYSVPSSVTLAGRGARIVMVLPLDNLAVFNAKCVEDIKRLAGGKANLCLPGNPATIARGRLSS